MLRSVNGFARYTKIYISFSLLIPKKWEYPATRWSWGCQISQILLHPAAFNNMQYTTKILRLRSPSCGLNKSCLGCHSLCWSYHNQSFSLGNRNVECKDSVQTEWLEYLINPTHRVQGFLRGVPEDSNLTGGDILWMNNWIPMLQHNLVALKQWERNIHWCNIICHMESSVTPLWKPQNTNVGNPCYYSHSD